MMRPLRDENGFVLVTAIILLVVMLGLGIALVAFTNSQQSAAAREQASEVAFNVAEAALNAQISQLSHKWPSTAALGEQYPTCTPTTSTSTNGCPSAPSLAAAYPTAGSSTCPAGTKTEAWGSSLANPWTTYVREDYEGSQYFNSDVEEGLPNWANGRNQLWVRAVGVAQCHFVTLVSLVSRQEIPATFPEEAAVANWFETSNAGKKLIVDTKGNAQQNGAVSMRCEAPHEEPNCKEWEKSKEQVSPDTTGAAPTPSPTFSTAQLEALREQAEAEGTYFSTAHGCPSSLEQLTGMPTYVEGPCNLSFNGGTANSEASPGFLVLLNGTLRLNANGQFFGVIYAANKQESSGVVVEIHGCNKVTGGIDVDGPGGISFGSCKDNFVYDPTAIKNLKLYAGAAGTRNSFRVLSANE
jgi:Tfp pilus assembly protein PilX